MGNELHFVCNALIRISFMRCVQLQASFIRFGWPPHWHLREHLFDSPTCVVCSRHCWALIIASLDIGASAFSGAENCGLFGTSRFSQGLCRGWPEANGLSLFNSAAPATLQPHRLCVRPYLQCRIHLKALYAVWHWAQADSSAALLAFAFHCQLRPL